ncbi:MAG TPA: hypothetical protein VNP72_09775 [Longimicrobium sp.]|nr:hypothetical protein [Longimicrobium sp.]
MKKAAVGLCAAVAVLALASPAQAQICAGFPSVDRGFYFGGRVDFPDDFDSFGVEANYNAAGPLSVYGGVNVLSGEGDDDESENEFVAGVAFETASLGMMIGPRVSVCPVVELSYLNIGDDTGDVTFMTIPIGLGIGASLGVPGIGLSGYVQPQFVISRAEFDTPLLDDTETETDFGIKAGVFAKFSMISVGGEVRHIFIEDGPDPVFGIRVGIAVP